MREQAAKDAAEVQKRGKTPLFVHVISWSGLMQNTTTQRLPFRNVLSLSPHPRRMSDEEPFASLDRCQRSLSPG